MTDQIQKKKPQATATRCWLDLVDIPPQAFALPGDGRKSHSLQGERKSIALKLAKHAHSDGSNSYPSVKTIMAATGRSRATVFRLLKDLRTLGFLRDGTIHEFHKTRIRSLDITKLRPVSDSPVDPSQVHRSPVSDSQGHPSQIPDDPSQIGGHPSQIAPDSQRPITVPSERPSERPQTERESETGPISPPANREETAMEKARRRKGEYQKRLLEGR